MYPWEQSRCNFHLSFSHHYLKLILTRTSSFTTQMSSSTNTAKPAFYSSSDVADALLVLGHPDAGYVPDLHLWSPQYKAGNTRRESCYSLSQIGPWCPIYLVSTLTTLLLSSIDMS